MDQLGDWLGTGRVANYYKEYLPFGEARLFVHTLNLKTRQEWRNYCKSGAKPENIPGDPNETYKSKGWIGIGDWLGTGAVATFDRDYLSFEEARAFVHNLNLKNREAWRNYCKSGLKPIDIPAKPERKYKDKGWVSWLDWVGTKIATIRV